MNGPTVTMLARSVARAAARTFLRRSWPLLLLPVLAFGAGTWLVLTQAAEGKMVLAGSAIYAPLILGFVAMSGLVGDERQTGFIVVWFQKPALIFRVYGLRYALQQTLVLTCVLLLALVLLGIARLTHLFELKNALRLCAGMLPLALIPAAMVFACSAWGIQRDAITAFLITLTGIGLSALKSGDDHLLSRLVQFLAFPIDPIMSVIGSPGYAVEPARAVLILLAQFCIWTLVGLIGLRRLDRSLRL